MAPASTSSIRRESALGADSQATCCSALALNPATNLLAPTWRRPKVPTCLIGLRSLWPILRPSTRPPARQLCCDDWPQQVSRWRNLANRSKCLAFDRLAAVRCRSACATCSRRCRRRRRLGNRWPRSRHDLLNESLVELRRSRTRLELRYCVELASCEPNLGVLSRTAPLNNVHI